MDATVNPVNDNKCFQYTETVALNHEETGTHFQKISKIELSMYKYNRIGINYLSEKNVWKNFEKNDPTIALNKLHVKKMNNYPSYISKHNLNCEYKLFF